MFWVCECLRLSCFLYGGYLGLYLVFVNYGLYLQWLLSVFAVVLSALLLSGLLAVHLWLFVGLLLRLLGFGWACCSLDLVVRFSCCLYLFGVFVVLLLIWFCCGLHGSALIILRICALGW